MGVGVKVNVWGDYALFTRPELKTERYSYDIITPSAARGILEAIYWHPGMRWIIDKIYVKNPIQFTSVRRNEVISKISKNKMLDAYNGVGKSLYICTKEEIVQRASVLLCNVSYVIEAHFEITPKAKDSDNPGKFKDIIMRRLRRGECYSMPYFGCREFPAHFALCEEEEIHTAYDVVEEKDLGIMLFDMDYSDPEDIKPMFFRAIMRHGVVDLRDCEVLRDPHHSGAGAEGAGAGDALSDHPGRPARPGGAADRVLPSGLWAGAGHGLLHWRRYRHQRRTQSGGTHLPEKIKLAAPRDPGPVARLILSTRPGREEERKRGRDPRDLHIIHPFCDRLDYAMEN